jgi:hypothetical protein
MAIRIAEPLPRISFTPFTQEQWDRDQEQRAIAAGTLAAQMGRQSPCYRGFERQYRALCLQAFKAAKAS